jgi:hypothetical protein
MRAPFGNFWNGADLRRLRLCSVRTRASASAKSNRRPRQSPQDARAGRRRASGDTMKADRRPAGRVGGVTVEQLPSRPCRSFPFQSPAGLRLAASSPSFGEPLPEKRGSVLLISHPESFKLRQRNVGMRCQTDCARVKSFAPGNRPRGMFSAAYVGSPCVQSRSRAKSMEALIFVATDADNRFGGVIGIGIFRSWYKEAQGHDPSANAATLSGASFAPSGSE